MRPLLAGALLAALAVEWSWASQAAACVLPAPPEFAVDPSLVRLDVEPPSAPQQVTALTSRFSGTFCSGDICTANSCGSSAQLHLQFQPAVDDQTPEPQLGYQLKFRDGVVPPELEAPLGQVHVGSSPLSVRLPDAFDAVLALDASFELVALDRAGNESPSSGLFRVAFDDCTYAFSVDGCVEDLGRPVSCGQGSCVESASSGCSLARGTGAGSRGTVAAALLALGLSVAAVARRRRGR